MTLRTPPREPPEPSGICEQLTVWQMVVCAVAGAVLFYGVMIALPNVGGY